MKWQQRVSVMVVVLAVAAGAARADVFNMGQDLTSLEFVTVGNPGNVNDSYDAGYGAVDYVYQIGKYEVTTGQYTAFLNAVAASDTYDLYDTEMWSSEWGCKIERSGSSGSYSYSVAADRANRPVSNVSWGDAARFVNWLHNGQPTGAQEAATTEDGAYELDGAISELALTLITRKLYAKYWIPTEDEWYKAAYHKNDGVTGNYWDYPTSSDNEPSNQLGMPDPGKYANFDKRTEILTLGEPYYMTEVGTFTNSDSPYGTFDQGGNVKEWNEAMEWNMGIHFQGYRGLRGGSWRNDSDLMHASSRSRENPQGGNTSVGFRVAAVPEPGSITVPEPGSITLMLCGAIAGLLWRRHRK